jgi:hypothetical protein
MQALAFRKLFSTNVRLVRLAMGIAQPWIAPTSSALQNCRNPHERSLSGVNLAIGSPEFDVK